MSSVFAEAAQPFQCSAFAGCPRFGESVIPANFGQQRQLANRHAGERAFDCRQLAWCALGCGQHRELLFHRAPEGCEHTIGQLLTIQNRAGLEQQRRIELFDGHVIGAQCLCHLGITLERGGFVDLVPAHQRRAGLLDQLSKGMERWSAADDESAAQLPDRVFQRYQGVMQPPAAGGAAGPMQLFFGVPEEQGDRVFGLLQGMEQGAVIGESQVLAKPN